MVVVALLCEGRNQFGRRQVQGRLKLGCCRLQVCSCSKVRYLNDAVWSSEKSLAPSTGGPTASARWEIFLINISLTHHVEYIKTYHKRGDVLLV